MDTSSADTGSSQTISFGPITKGTCNTKTLYLPTGKLVRENGNNGLRKSKKGHSQSALLLAHNKNEIAKQSHFR